MWKRHQTPVWIQVLSGTYCASHRTIRFWEAMWHSVKILLCNYSTRYLSHSRQLLSILWIKWPESFSHILPLTSSHSHIDSTYHVILICYYSSYHAIWGPLGNCDCWALKHQQKKKYGKIHAQNSSCKTLLKPSMLSGQARKGQCPDESWMEAIFCKCNGNCNLLWKGTHTPVHMGNSACHGGAKKFWLQGISCNYGVFGLIPMKWRIIDQSCAFHNRGVSFYMLTLSSDIKYKLTLGNKTPGVNKSSEKLYVRERLDNVSEPYSIKRGRFQPKMYSSEVRNCTKKKKKKFLTD